MLRGERYDQACKRLDDRKQQASLDGRGLAIWKQQKPLLGREVETLARSLL
ncbi:hypothetical protein P2Q70_01380 [Pseudomonas mendocina]|uniref:hypothetical protein n=1 Tax=Ectopseudomonas mendocina TaxID=300 RepID=UPI002114D57E|nr:MULTISPECIES: hypothetical protein [Pseudomonas]MDF2073223.1 hypothetical protein [Pseudomonas mendocina]